MNCRSDLGAGEMWKDVPGFDGLYQASTLGRIRRVWKKSNKTTVLRPVWKRKSSKTRKTQLRIRLMTPDGRRKERTVLKVIAETFIGDLAGKEPIHRNGCHADCALDNILLMTKKQLGERYGGDSGRMPVAKVDANGEVIAFYPSARAAARENFVSYQTVMNRCNGKVKNEFALDGYSFRWDD